jgi:hypothetical protein
MQPGDALRRARIAPWLAACSLLSSAPARANGRFPEADQLVVAPGRPDGLSFSPYGVSIDPSVFVLTLDVAPTNAHRVYASGTRTVDGVKSGLLFVSSDDTLAPDHLVSCISRATINQYRSFVQASYSNRRRSVSPLRARTKLCASCTNQALRFVHEPSSALRARTKLCASCTNQAWHRLGTEHHACRNAPCTRVTRSTVASS